MPARYPRATPSPGAALAGRLASRLPRLHALGPVLFLQGVGAAFALLGALPVLFAVGLIPADTPSPVLARTFALAFGGILMAVGAGISLLWLRPVARAAGGRTVGATVQLARHALARRVDARSALSALTTGAVALGYWGAIFGIPSGTRVDPLVHLVSLEFLVIHGFPFLVFGAPATRAASRGFRLFGIAWMVMLMSMYGAVAWTSAGGPLGVAALVYLLIPNVLVFMRRPEGWAVRAAAVWRWVVKFFLFVVIATALDVEGMFEGGDALRLGAAYFTVQALLDLLRIAEIPIDLAGAWLRLPAADRELPF